MGSYLSVRIWEPNFVLKELQIQTTTIWIQISQLPTEFYDKEILEKMREIGKLLKNDACTSATLRGRYARIYVQVPLDKPLMITINIGNHQ